MNKQNRNRLINTDIRIMVPRGKGLGGLGKNGDGIKKYKLVETE